MGWLSLQSGTRLIEIGPIPSDEIAVRSFLDTAIVVMIC